MLSTPPAMTISASPELINLPACAIASAPEPHKRFTVTAGTVTGIFASSALMRATFRLSSPAPLLLPAIISSIVAESRLGTLESKFWKVRLNRSSGRTDDMPPRYFPNGVRDAAAITARF